MDFNGLNDDCLSIIFGLIPLKQLIVDRRVCKHWRQRIDDFIISERHLVYNQSINSCKRDQYFYKYKENVESIMDLNQFERCVQLMPRLTQITLNGIKANDGMLPLLANNCPNITRIHVMSGEESLTFVGFKYLVEKYPLLTHLDLPNCQLDDDLIHIITTNLQNLVHFNFGTDRHRGGTHSTRLSRFTGQTLKNICPKIKTLMIGESMYWDEQLIHSLTNSCAKNVTTLRIHLLKLKSFQSICENMIQLKQFYCSFNGGDINTNDNNVGCVKHLAKLHNLEVLELIDDGRHHCGVKGCYSVYTLTTLTDAVKGMPKLKVLKLMDFDNWHSETPNIDPLLSVLKEFCPNLIEFGISAGLFQLKTESYGLISMFNVRRLSLQGDTSLIELNNNTKKDYLSNDVIIDLFKSNPHLVRLKVENCPLVDEEGVTAVLNIVSQRKRQTFEIIFENNVRINSLQQIKREIPENVSLIIQRREEDDEDLFHFNYSDDDSDSFDSTDSLSLHSFSGEDIEDEDF